MTPYNNWWQFSTPGYGGAPNAQPTQVPGIDGGSGLPGAQPLGIPDFSRMNPGAPQGWRSSVMPIGGGMARNQSPSLLQNMVMQMSQGNIYNPMKAFAGMAMNPRYQSFAGMKPDGQIGKGGNPAMMGMGQMGPLAGMIGSMGKPAPQVLRSGPGFVGGERAPGFGNGAGCGASGAPSGAQAPQMSSCCGG